MVTQNRDNTILKIYLMQVYGIDIANTHLDIYWQDTNEKVFVKRIANKFKSITKFLQNINPKSIICAEHTGVYGDLLVELCCCSDISIALIEGYTISKSFANEKGKSDQIDAKRIWEYGCRFLDKLHFSKASNESLKELKELQSLRNQLVKQRKMIKTNQKGKQKKTSLSITARKIESNILNALNQQIKEVEKQIQRTIKENAELLKNFNLATSVIGVGDVIATELIIYTDNFKKIDTAKKAASFAGVCPFLNQSGSISKKPKVPKRSHKKLKSLLFLSAINVSSFNKEMKLYKERKTMQGKHFFLIMNNIANKILRIIFSVVKSGIPYDPNYVCVDPRN